MNSDSLQIINAALVSKMLDMDRDELWQLAETSLRNPEPQKRYETIYFNAVGNLGMEKIRDVFYRLYEHHRESTVYGLIEDLCFEGEEVELDYYARCGYLDSGGSCLAQSSEVLIPFDNEAGDDWFNMKRFDILTGRDVERIVRSMEKNLASMTVNTPEDIPKVRSIMQVRCYHDEGYNAAYFYNNV